MIRKPTLLIAILGLLVGIVACMEIGNKTDSEPDRPEVIQPYKVAGKEVLISNYTLIITQKTGIMVHTNDSISHDHSLVFSSLIPGRRDYQPP